MISPRCANQCMRTNRGTIIEHMSSLFVLKQSFWPRTKGIGGNKRMMSREDGVVRLADPSDRRVQDCCLITKLAVCSIPIHLEGKVTSLPHRVILIRKPSSSMVDHGVGRSSNYLLLDFRGVSWVSIMMNFREHRSTVPHQHTIHVPAFP